MCSHGGDSINNSNKLNLKYDNIEKNELLNHLLSKIRENKFRIVMREKNVKTMTLYNLDRIKIKELLLKLELNDFYQITLENNYELNGPGIYYIFKKNFRLLNLNGVENDIKMYIKFKIIEGKEIIPLISFHEDE